MKNVIPAEVWEAIFEGVPKDAWGVRELPEGRFLYDVAWAFEKLEGDARRLAEGGKALCDLSPGGRLAKLAEEAAKAMVDDGGIPNAYPDPVAELSRAVEALRGLARWQDETSIPEAEKDGAAAQCAEEVLTWRMEEREQGRLAMEDAEKHLSLRRAAAGELAANCRACSFLAMKEAEWVYLWEFTKAQHEAKVAALMAAAAKARAREENAKAEMYNARKEVEEEKAAREEADKARREAEVLTAEAKAKAEVYRQMMMGEFGEIKRGVQEAAAQAKAAKHAAAGAHAEAVRGRLAAEGAWVAAEEGASAAQGAERASLRAEAAAKGKAAADSQDADLVATFFDAEEAFTEEGCGSIEETLGGVGGVLPMARLPKDKGGKGRNLGRLDVWSFKKLYDGWIVLGKPDVRQYMEIHKRLGRRPNKAEAEAYMKETRKK